jgi:hypothetical protein
MPLSEAPPALQEAAVDDPRLCAQCGGEYKSLSGHWSQNPSCSWPDVSDYKKEILTGIMMGDGYADGSSKNTNIEVIMINYKYLNFIDREFGNISTGVYFYRSAEESARMNRENGFSEGALAKNYHDKYRLRTISHPSFNMFSEWYSTGKKKWPSDIHLTPTVLKHWYVGDGDLNTTSSNKFLRISSVNEIENKDKVESLFEESSLPPPDNWEAERMVWNVENTEHLLSYMGDPLPGFEYKWL